MPVEDLGGGAAGAEAGADGVLGSAGPCDDGTPWSALEVKARRAGSPPRSGRRPRWSSASRRSRSASPGRPANVLPPSQHVPSLWTRSMTASVRRVVVAEAHEHLVEDDVVEDLGAGLGGQPVGHPARVVAAAVDQRGDAVAAERAQRGVERHAAGAARELGVPVQAPRLARRRATGCTARRGHRGAVRLGVGDDRDARSRTGRSATCGRRSPTSPPARAPASRCAPPRAAAAHSPNAPSTWHQAPWRGRRRRSRRTGRTRPC